MSSISLLDECVLYQAIERDHRPLLSLCQSEEEEDSTSDVIGECLVSVASGDVIHPTLLR